MIKVIVAIPKRPDLDAAAFHRHWREPHGRLALNIKPMRRYVQAHRIPHPGTGFPAGPYEGFAEVWFDDLRTALGLGQDPDYQRYLVPDEPNFCDVAGLTPLVTEEEVVIPGPPMAKDDRYFKITHLVRRRADCPAFAFKKGWTSAAADRALAEQLGAIRCVRCISAPGTEPQPGSGYDAVRELWWPNLEAFDTMRGREPAAWRLFIDSPVADAAANFVVPVEENRVLWP